MGTLITDRNSCNVPSNHFPMHAYRDRDDGALYSLGNSFIVESIEISDYVEVT